jgi:hypothetical protein
MPASHRSDVSDLPHRLAALETRVRRLSLLSIALGGCLALLVLPGMIQDARPSEITASKLTVVDEQGRPRVVIGPDPPDVQRISHSAGLVLLDETGHERGGFTARWCSGWTRRPAWATRCATASGSRSTRTAPRP